MIYYWVSPTYMPSSFTSSLEDGGADLQVFHKDRFRYWHLHSVHCLLTLMMFSCPWEITASMADIFRII